MNCLPIFNPRFLLAVLLLGVTFSHAVLAATESDQGVDISDPTQVAELAAIQKQMDGITESLMVCVQGGKPQAACLCQDVASIVAFNTLVKDTDARHPEWQSLDIVRYRAADGTMVSESLDGLRRQAASQPFCP